ncbi:MAG: hypothetical protein IE933_01760 [Sphingomonadales bacterium]|nr:hypothetical protein [Sphingomonadales bacterium]MBD3773353.1 hypothetical protein [Paracoccaceae bacterium]
MLESWILPLMAAVAIASAATLLATRYIGGEETSRAAALVASLIMAAVISFSFARYEAGENVANGLEFYVALVRAFIMWVGCTITVLVLHPRCVRNRP